MDKLENLKNSIKNNIKTLKTNSSIDKSYLTQSNHNFSNLLDLSANNSSNLYIATQNQEINQSRQEENHINTNNINYNYNDYDRVKKVKDENNIATKENNIIDAGHSPKNDNSLSYNHDNQYLIYNTF